MAISRSLMNRQLQANGGIMQVAPREKFGLGSKLKKFVRKIIPNEVADIAVKAAPFVAPFNPALAGAMAGIGSFDQTGSIGDSLKRGALTYGGGQLARYAGGAGFQGNPFASGGAFTPSGFTSGFSSPIGTDTGLGKFFSNRGTQPVSSVGDGLTGSEVGGEITLAESAGSTGASPNILAEQMSEVSLTPQNIAEKVTQETLTGSPKQMTITESIQKILSPNSTLNERGSEALNLLKRGTKAAFTKPDGKGGTTLDKAAVMGALAFSASYAEAKALAAETGIDTDLTEAEYDELKKAEKQEEYAGYLTNFFAGKKDGGRIGFKFGSEPEDAEIGIMTIDVEAGDDEKEENDLMAGITFSSAEKSYLFRRLGGAGGASRSYTMPQLYRILSNPNRYATDAAILKEIAIMGMKADGGRIGFAGGSNRVSELLVLRDGILAKDADADVSDIEAELFQLTGKTFRSVGGIGDVPTGKLTQNKAGVIERDYRDEGGFVPVGVKEKADDVPAMLSKNEFVMTADAVRGIGGGDVEEGSKKLYKTMKQAEQVGKA
jgi:hypothetical protein